MFSGRGETQQQLLQALQREPEGLAVEPLSQMLGITVTAVRNHLTALGRDGLVVQRLSTPSGGRPAHIYALTTEAREEFPRQYSWFSEVLLNELRERLGPANLERTLAALGKRAAGPAPDSDVPMAERVEALVSKMSELGYDAYRISARGDTAEIGARNCVFHHLAKQRPEVCSFDLGLIGAATGASVSHEECIVRGGKCCRFKLRGKE